MTLPKRSLLPASGDDVEPLLGALERAARHGLQFLQIVRAVVGQRVPLEPGPQVFERIEIGRICGTKAIWTVRPGCPETGAPKRCDPPPVSF